MTFDVEVRITPREGILDPEGETIARALGALGYDGVRDVRSGRLITLRLEAKDAAAARAAVSEMCERLIANPIIEDYQVDVAEAGNPVASDGASGSRGPSSATRAAT